MMAQQQPIVIKIKAKSKKQTVQGQRDSVHLTERIHKSGQYFYFFKDFLSKALGGDMRRVRLVRLAMECSYKNNITLDRLAKRIKDATICWFCENWNIIKNNFGACVAAVNEDSGFMTTKTIKDHEKSKSTGGISVIPIPIKPDACETIEIPIKKEPLKPLIPSSALATAFSAQSIIKPLIITPQFGSGELPPIIS